ncbi:hypothetical protein BHM03_00055369, partial [Ensete ventricosum]
MGTKSRKKRRSGWRGSSFSPPPPASKCVLPSLGPSWWHRRQVTVAMDSGTGSRRGRVWGSGAVFLHLTPPWPSPLLLLRFLHSSVFPG